MKSIDDEQLAALRAELFAGRKISAVKIYRDATGLGLKEAKDVVEALEDELRQREPEKFTAKKSGCATAVLFVAGSLIVAVVETALW